MTGQEIELKLGLPPADMALLGRRSGLDACLLEPERRRRLVSTYFDTPDFALAAAGLSLRVRETADGLVQTVKTAGSGASGLFRRGEWETAVAGPLPDSGHLRATGLPPLAEASVTDALVPVFTTRIDRTTLRLGDGETWEVEVALDLGEVAAGDRREAVSEVELELKSGGPEHLFRLARQVLAAGGGRPLALAKSDRGYRLAAGRADAPVKARPPALTPDMTVAAAFQAIARACLDHLLVNERCLLATGDGEAVHQMRVALRRFRSALKIFAPVLDRSRLPELKDGLRWLLGHLGPARDSGVFLTEIIDPVAARYPGDKGLDALREYWRLDHEARLAAALEAVRSPRFALLVLELGEWVEVGPWLVPAEKGRARRLESPVAAFAANRMDKMSRKLRASAGDHLGRLGHEELHMVRIRAKQVRYAGEFFASLMPRRRMRSHLAALSDLQDQLGRLNDIAVAAPRLGGHHVEGGRAKAAGLVSGWHMARRSGLLRGAEKAWTRWRSLAAPWGAR